MDLSADHDVRQRNVRGLGDGRAATGEFLMLERVLTVAFIVAVMVGGLFLLAGPRPVHF